MSNSSNHVCCLAANWFRSLNSLPFKIQLTVPLLASFWRTVRAAVLDSRVSRKLISLWLKQATRKAQNA
jgi:hypothetical protein